MVGESAPLHGLDLNLLVSLRALLRDKSVTRAAARLGQSQPTVSRALQTLRVAFDDDLLTRSGRAMTLTPLGNALVVPVERFLNAANRLASVGTFEPSTAQRTFHISVPDFAAATVVPDLASEFIASAPQCTLIVSGGEREQLDGLLDGTLDLAVGLQLDHAELKCRSFGGSGSWVVVLGPTHPAFEGPLDVESWLSSQHLQLVPHGRPSTPSAIDECLSRMGRIRTIAMKLGHVAPVSQMLERSALVLSIPRSMASHIAEGRRLRIHDHPLAAELPPPSLAVMWHESMHHDAGHKWLRTLFQAACAD